MKYRAQLFWFFLGISGIVLITSLVVVIVQGREAVLRDIQGSVVTAAATIAVNIDGDLVEQIKVLEDEKKPAYEQIRQYLRKARDANRNEYVRVRFVYTLYPDPKNPTKFLFGIDAEETEKDLSHAGTEATGAADDNLVEHLTERYSSGKLVKDQWGTWLTGYAPIYNSKGNYVATVGVDIAALYVRQMMDRLLFHGVIAIAVCAFLAVLSANFLARRASSAVNILMQATAEIGKGNFATRVDFNRKDEFQDLGNALNEMCISLQEKERMQAGFAHYVSKHVMEAIKTQGAPTLGGARKKITVFFCDIRDFTQMAEKMPPEEVMAILNEYFQAMLDIIFKHNGMLDKLIGDAIMAEFGYPIEDPQQERNAVLTAIEMQHSLSLLRAKWKMEGKPEIFIGVGINTGEAIVGTVGSADRVEFTAVGDTVNIASRLEHATRECKENIIVSETTFLALKNEFPGKFLGALQLPGKEQPVNAYAIQRVE